MARQRKTAALVKRLLLFLAFLSFGCLLAARFIGGRSQATSAPTAAAAAQPPQPPPQPAFPNANPPSSRRPRSTAGRSSF
jgi:hypothetical protein